LTGPSTWILNARPGCVVPRHSHTAEEQLIVVRGAVMVEMTDHPRTRLGPGGFAVMGTHMAHQFACQGTAACVISSPLIGLTTSGGSSDDPCQTFSLECVVSRHGLRGDYALSFVTRRWRNRDSNPRSLPLDFRDEGQVQGGVARTSIKIFPNGSRFAVEPGGTTQVESYSSMMQGPALGSRRSERFMIAVSHQPWAGPK